MTFEYRVGWSASSNIHFRGTSDWMEWGGFEEAVEEVEKALEEGGCSLGLDTVLNAAGIEWWSEVREAGAVDA